jgi:hypothetical protein
MGANSHMVDGAGDGDHAAVVRQNRHVRGPEAIHQRLCVVVLVVMSAVRRNQVPYRVGKGPIQ